MNKLRIVTHRDWKEIVKKKKKKSSIGSYQITAHISMAKQDAKLHEGRYEMFGAVYLEPLIAR